MEKSAGITQGTEIIELLSISSKDEMDALFEKAAQIRNTTLGNKVYFRGLIEYSNLCSKNCFYCGIRRDSRSVGRYTMTDDEVLEAAEFAFKSRYGSVVIQSGERTDEAFAAKMEFLVRQIKKLSNGELGITLSLGEQSRDTYRRWYEAGAHRYLLRVETSDRKLYSKIHPDDNLHGYESRIEALRLIKEVGFQTGTGVMIGLPGQTVKNLADDLLFLKKLDVDMVGMGPYIESEDTPMYAQKDTLIPRAQRFELALKMIAVLRQLMPDINIAATTAMQALDPLGREKAVKAGANIVMPNLTPVKYRKSYQLYDGKPCLDEDAAKCTGCLSARIRSAGAEVGLGEWGDSTHFAKRTKTPSNS